MALQMGVARLPLSPPRGVELAGWGYYLGRKWQGIRDQTAATALVFDDGNHAAALVAVDLMYADEGFTTMVRCEVPELILDGICVACSHSHNTPTAAFIRGAGEINEEYRTWAARQAGTAVHLAWQKRQPATLRVGHTEVEGWTYNRTREDGPVDTRLTVWRVDDSQGRPMVAVVNFQAHPTVMMGLGATDLSRDFPGQVTDFLEEAIPGLTALYLQGSCGDVNFDQCYHEPERCHEPARVIAMRALEAMAAARPVESPLVGFAAEPVFLPTRRWERSEVVRDNEEGWYRLRTGDTTSWRENLGRVMVNNPERFPERYGGDLKLAVRALGRFAVEWSEQMLKDLDDREEILETEAQAICIGDAYLVANPAELFASWALDLRRQRGHEDLMIVGYANDSIGYLPDAYDLERRTYAACQSPKFKNQFPFVAESGQVMLQGMLTALERARHLSVESR